MSNSKENEKNLSDEVNPYSPDLSLPNKGWTVDREEVVQKWIDRAQCYKWLNEQTFERYKKINYCFSIPVIVISTVTGTASFGLDAYVDTEDRYIVQSLIGTMSLGAGIISTLGNFFRYSEKMEKHRIVATQWDKLYRFMETELSLHPMLRKDSKTFIRNCQHDIEKIMENMPKFPEEIIKRFEKQFKHKIDLIKPTSLDHFKIPYSSITVDEALEIIKTNQETNTIFQEKKADETTIFEKNQDKNQTDKIEHPINEFIIHVDKTENKNTDKALEHSLNSFSEDDKV
jgi:hypothetical protein